jgi:hypothetical protein
MASVVAAVLNKRNDRVTPVDDGVEDEAWADRRASQTQAALDMLDREEAAANPTRSRRRAPVKMKKPVLHFQSDARTGELVLMGADDDGDGVIDRGELATVLKAMGVHDVSMVHTLMDAYDIDGMGTLDRAEVTQLMRSLQSGENEAVDAMLDAEGKVVRPSLVLKAIHDEASKQADRGEHYTRLCAFLFYFLVFVSVLFLQRHPGVGYRVESTIVDALFTEESNTVEPESGRVSRKMRGRQDVYAWLRQVVVPLYTDPRCGDGACEAPQEFMGGFGGVGCEPDCGRFTNLTRATLEFDLSSLPWAKITGADASMTVRWNLCLVQAAAAAAAAGGGAKAARVSASGGRICAHDTAAPGASTYGPLLEVGAAAAFAAAGGKLNLTAELFDAAWELMVWTFDSAKDDLSAVEISNGYRPGVRMLLGGAEVLREAQCCGQKCAALGATRSAGGGASSGGSKGGAKGGAAPSPPAPAPVPTRCASPSSASRTVSVWRFSPAPAPGFKPASSRGGLASLFPEKASSRVRTVGSYNRLLLGTRVTQRRRALLERDSGSATAADDSGGVCSRRTGISSMCFADDSVEDRSPFGIDPAFLSTSVLYNSKAASLKPYFYSAAAGELNSAGVPFGFSFTQGLDVGGRGKESTPKTLTERLAGASGVGNFPVFFDIDITEDRAAQLLKYMEDGFYIDAHTSSVEVAMLLYNQHLDLFVFVRVDFGFDTGGAVLLDRRVWSVDTDVYHSAKDYGRLFLEVLFLLMLFGYVLRELAAVCRSPQGYCRASTIWTLLDVLNLLMQLTMFGLWVRCYAQLAPRFDPAPRYESYNGSTPYPSVDTAVGAAVASAARGATAVRALRLGAGYKDAQADLETLTQMATLLDWYFAVGAVSVILMVVRVLKLLHFQPRMGLVTRTLSRAFDDLAHFFCLFALVLLGYAFVGFMAFGSQVQEFAGLWRSAETCLEMLLGEVWVMQDLRVLGNAVVARIYFWSFIFLAFYILINMLLAIIVDAYIEIKKAAEESTTIWQDLDWFYAMFRAKLRSRSGVAPRAGKPQFVDASELRDKLAPAVVSVAAEAESTTSGSHAKHDGDSAGCALHGVAVHGSDAPATAPGSSSGERGGGGNAAVNVIRLSDAALDRRVLERMVRRYVPDDEHTEVSDMSFGAAAFELLKGKRSTVDTGATAELTKLVKEFRMEFDTEQDKTHRLLQKTLHGVTQAHGEARRRELKQEGRGGAGGAAGLGVVRVPGGGANGETAVLLQRLAQQLAAQGRDIASICRKLE